MANINWPVTIWLNLFRGFVCGCMFVLTSASPPPGGIVPSMLMISIIGPPILYAMRWVMMRIAMFIPFGILIQLAALVATGFPFVIADVIVWLALTILPNTFPLRAYSPFTLAAYIMVYDGGVSQELGFDLPASWRRGA